MIYFANSFYYKHHRLKLIVAHDFHVESKCNRNTGMSMYSTNGYCLSDHELWYAYTTMMY